MISATQADWTRETKPFWSWQPSRSLLASLRAYQRGNAFTRAVAVIRHLFWSMVTGADIPLNCQIEGGLLMPHPNGIVIHPGVKVGPNCLLFQQVTLGADDSGVPWLDGHVDIGAGAKVLGNVRIGAHARIGANSVVLCNVPAGCTAVGVPARLVTLPEEHSQDSWRSIVLVAPTGIEPVSAP